MRWFYSRRRVLRTVGVAGVAPFAGCVGWLTRSTSDTQELSVAEAEPEYTERAFEKYVRRMRDRYAAHGVWGIDDDGPATNGAAALTFVGAWSDRWVLGRQQQSGEQRIHVPIDASVALYRVRTEDQPTHRLWLWTAATPQQPNSGVGATKLTSLSVGVDLDSGELGSYEPSTSIHPDDTPLTIGTKTSPKAPSARFELPAGGFQPLPKATNPGKGGTFTVGWAGGYGDTISAVGVCELHRPVTHEYELTVTTGASASQGTL